MTRRAGQPIEFEIAEPDGTYTRFVRFENWQPRAGDTWRISPWRRVRVQAVRDRLPSSGPGVGVECVLDVDEGFWRAVGLP